MDLTNKVKWPAPGKYVVGVSGGVDSMVLLDLLASHGEYELVVAYVDHGWREVAAERELVREAAERVGAEFVAIKLELLGRSEAEAREHRYQALFDESARRSAAGVVTAHHQDDLIESILLNVMRGTGRAGLAPMGDTRILRPLIAVSRTEIEASAKERQLNWIEDPTNLDTTYLRNQVRRELIPKLVESDADFINSLLKMHTRAAKLNAKIDAWLNERINIKENVAKTAAQKLAKLPPEVIQEFIIYMARRLNPGEQINKRTAEQLAIDLKNRRLSSQRALSRQLFADLSRGTFTITFKVR